MTRKNTSINLRWSNHALIDMGLAAIVLSTANDRPEEVTQQQWKEWLNQVEQDYLKKLLKKSCSILFTLNAFDNPSWSKKPQERAKKIKEIFALARNGSKVQFESCAFFPEERAVVRAARDLFPMLLGRGQLNFYPSGRSEIPLSHLALGCVLSLPRAAPIVSGRAMIVETNDHELLLDLCDYWKESIDRELSLLRLSGGEWKDRKAPRTRLVEALDEVFGSNHHRCAGADYSSGVILYHLSNSGNGPAIDIYTVRPVVNCFLARAEAAAHRYIWKSLVKAFWIHPKKKKEKVYVDAILSKKISPPTEEEMLQAKNEIYELLPSLPDEASNFVRRIFLKFTFNRVGQRKDFRTVNVDVWPIVELFLTELLPTMTPERIEIIRRLADELAEEIHTNNDLRLYRQLMGLVSGSDHYSGFRTLLIKVVLKRLRRTNQLLLTLDDYLLLFEEAEGFPHADWRLVRDLVRIRVLENLHRTGFFAQKSELLDEEIETEETE